MSAIDVSGLRHSFGDRPILRDVSFTVATGQVVALLGPSGAGKTTLFRCVTGLLRPDAGRIVIAGHTIDTRGGRRLAAARRDIGVIFQQFNLVRRLSALDNALGGTLATTPVWRVIAGRRAASDRAAALSALERVGLADFAHQRADRLSGGQQQRVAVARALVQRSRVLLADEPVASLDPETAEQVMRLMREIAHERGMTVLCTLHQPELARRFADRTMTMRDGRVHDDG